MKLIKNKIKKEAFIFIVLVINTLSFAQKVEVELWQNEVPNAIIAKDYIEYYDDKTDRIGNVSKPTLSIFIPEKPNGTSIIICPGGGYQYLAINKEGYKTAEWLNTLGITVFVLKYRLPNEKIMQNKSIGPLQDAQEAVRFIRRNADKYKLNAEKIGVLGYSAGGHLAASLSTKYNEIIYQNNENISAKPNFSLLIYPVISMTNEITHKGSQNKLIGPNANDELINQFSTEKLITSETPPTFIVHANDDKTVSIENSLNYYLGLKKHNVISELHCYQTGGHGFGLGKKGTSNSWTQACEKWLAFNIFTN